MFHDKVMEDKDSSQTPPEQIVPTKPAQPLANEQPETKQFIFPQKLKLALLLFTLVGGVYAWAMPNLVSMLGKEAQPGFLELSLSGLVLIIFTAFLLKFAAKAIGFNRAWIILSLAYNAFIIAIKFVLAPISLYGRAYVLDLFSFNPNAGIQVYVFYGIITMCLYLLVFNFIYRNYKNKVQKVLTNPMESDVSRSNKPIKIGVIGGIMVLIILGSIATQTYILPLILVLISGQYLLYVFSSFVGVLILLVVGFTIYVAGQAFDEASNKAIEMKDATILASFFWIGLCMILSYHIMWVIYMSVLATIWPFRTFSPSGK